jgi:asparaginyl-tRNA synthetase
MMELAEEFLSFIVGRVLENRRNELAILERDTGRLERITPPFPRITYEEAVSLLQSKGNPLQFGDDFGGDEETLLSQQFDRPVIIHRYPAAIKAFYMQSDPVRPDLALCMDVLAPEGYGEIISSVFANISFQRKPFGGISICADMDRSLMLALGWELSVRWPGSAV